MFTWHKGLPGNITEDITKASIVFTASDGKTYPTQSSLGYNDGTIKTTSLGKQVVYSDGSFGPLLPKESQDIGTQDLQAQGGYTCNLSNGPYFWSWTSTGYAAIYSVLNILQTPLLPNITDASGISRPTAACAYVGGQASGRNVNAGLVYINGSLRIFVTDSSETNSADRYWEVNPGMTVGTDYPARLQVDGNSGFFFRVDTMGGTVLANLIANNIGTTYAGTGMYFKRAISIASGSLPNYDGTSKYNATNYARHSNSKVATYQNGGFNYQAYSGVIQNTTGCQVPNSTQVQITSDSATTDTVTVSINMNR